MGQSVGVPRPCQPCLARPSTADRTVARQTRNPRQRPARKTRSGCADKTAARGPGRRFVRIFIDAGASADTLLPDSSKEASGRPGRPTSRICMSAAGRRDPFPSGCVRLRSQLPRRCRPRPRAPPSNCTPTRRSCGDRSPRRSPRSSRRSILPSDQPSAGCAGRPCTCTWRPPVCSRMRVARNSRSGSSQRHHSKTAPAFSAA